MSSFGATYHRQASPEDLNHYPKYRITYINPYLGGYAVIENHGPFSEMEEKIAELQYEDKKVVGAHYAGKSVPI